MALLTFDESLDFAISREKEAVAFYQDLQAMARFGSQKELMKEFEDMEKGHVTLLEGVKKNQAPERLSKGVPTSLHLDAFLVAAPTTAEMNYQDILIIAIKREKLSSSLYTALRDDSSDEGLKEVFKRLIVEEDNHRDYFERLYEKDIQSAN